MEDNSKIELTNNEKVRLLKELKTLQLATVALLHQSDVRDDHWADCDVDLFDLVVHINHMASERIALASHGGFLHEALDVMFAGCSHE